MNWRHDATTIPVCHTRNALCVKTIHGSLNDIKFVLDGEVDKVSIYNAKHELKHSLIGWTHQEEYDTEVQVACCSWNTTQTMISRCQTWIAWLQAEHLTHDGLLPLEWSASSFSSPSPQLSSCLLLYGDHQAAMWSHIKAQSWSQKRITRTIWGLCWTWGALQHQTASFSWASAWWLMK